MGKVPSQRTWRRLIETLVGGPREVVAFCTECGEMCRVCMCDIDEGESVEMVPLYDLRALFGEDS